MADLIVLLFLCTVGALFIALLVWNVVLFFKVGLPGYRKLRDYLKEPK